MLESESATHGREPLAEADRPAAAELWERYGTELANLAQGRHPAALSSAIDRTGLSSADDGENRTQNLLLVLWSEVSQGPWNSLQSRNELWWLLLEITRRKAFARLADEAAREQQGVVSSDEWMPADAEASAVELLETVDMRGLPLDMATLLKGEHDRLMDSLPDDTLRQIAGSRLEGDTPEDIAARRQISRRAVIRKLNLIRDCWSREFFA